MNRMADDEAKILAEAGDELWKWTKRIDLNLRYQATNGVINMTMSIC